MNTSISADQRAPGPIFIGGMYKSGTSLLRAMLGQHPALFSGFETGWCVPGNFENYEPWLKLLSGLFDAPKDYLSGLRSRSECIEAFLTQFMNDQCRRAGKDRWIEKTPLNAANIPRILDYWPDARIIVIFRHPMDVYASLVFSGKWGNAEEFSFRWCSTCGEGARTIMTTDAKLRSVHTLKYESLIENPIREMRAVCTHVDIPWVPEVSTYAGTPREAEKIKQVLGRTSSTAERMREPLNSGRIGVSRDLSAQQQRIYQDAVEQIAARGFAAEFEFVSRLYLQGGPENHAHAS